MRSRDKDQHASRNPQAVRPQKASFFVVILLALNVISLAVLLGPNVLKGRTETAEDVRQITPVLLHGPVAQRREAEDPNVTELSPTRLPSKLSSPGDEKEAETSRPGRDVVWKQARDLLAKGNYGLALELYKSIVENDRAMPRGQLAYEMAVCFEWLHDVNRAHRHYELALETDVRELRHAARFGQSRAQYGAGNVGEATRRLSDLLLATSNRQVLRSGLTAEVNFTWAEFLLASLFRDNRVSVLDRVQPMSVNLPIAHERLLAIAQPLDQEWQDDLPDDEIEARGPKRGHPNIISVSARFQQASLWQLLQRCASATGHTLEASEDLKAELNAHAVPVYVQDFSMSSLLHLVLHPRKATWHYAKSDGKITLASRRHAVTAATHRQLLAAELAIRNALAVAPDHPHAARAFTMLANLAFHKEALDDASAQYRDVIDRYRKHPVRQLATFNLAKCLLRQEKHEEAEKQLLAVVDLQLGNDLETASYLLLGERMLCRRDARTAVRVLTRAVTRAKSDELKGFATLALAVSYLRTGNARMASNALVGAGETLQQDAFRDEAALIAAYANYQSATSDDQIQRYGRRMTAAIGHTSPRSFFGAIGFILFNDIFRELGMVDQSVEALEDAIEFPVAQPLRDEFTFELGRYYLMERRHNRFVIVMNKLKDEGHNDWPVRARLQLAEFALEQGDFDKCMAVCEELAKLSDSTEEKAKALRLLGRVYEEKKDHYRAAICFAGLLPKKEFDGDEASARVAPMGPPEVPR